MYVCMYVYVCIYHAHTRDNNGLYARTYIQSYMHPNTHVIITG